MNNRPSKREILHGFMLWYQDKYGRAASLATALEYCPLWSARQGVHLAIKSLAKDGLAKQRPVNEPGQRAHNKWWAVDAPKVKENNK